MPLRIATRKSPLALWQANHVRNLLLQQSPNLAIELIPLVTSGDVFLDRQLAAIGGKGLFVKELEEALLDGRADLAVHSMKDVPVLLPEGLVLSTILTRHNPFDAFVSNRYSNLASLPPQAIVGTVSLRRQSQLRMQRPDLQIQPLRGNLQTRLEKLDNQLYDGIILAVAGLERLSMHTRITEVLSDELMLPACGQGAIGIECRADDTHLHAVLAPLHDPNAAQCIQAERQVNAALGGNCHTPLAVYCENLSKDTLRLRAKLASLDGKTVISVTEIGLPDQSAALAAACIESLLNQGASALMLSC